MDSMAVKLIGAVVLTVAGLMIGRALSSACVRRVEALRAFREALVPLEIKMLHETLPLSKALLASRFDVFMALSQAISEGDGAGEAWGIMADTLYAHGGQFDCLEDADRENLKRFFDELGLSGQAEQRALFEKTAEELKQLESAACVHAAEVSKLYTTLGALGGMALAIALL